MRLATWNVNSIRTRVTRTVEFAVREDIDVLAMQEIKCKPEQFPYGPFEEAGYHVEVHGLNQWNGVAIASRLPITDVRTAFDGMPGFAKGHEGPDAPLEARALGVMVEGVRVWSLYVPNGRSLEDPHYAYKLHWLEALRNSTAAELSANPDLPLALVGDFNIIPFDTDNGDPDIVEGVSTHVSPAERQAFFAFQDAGSPTSCAPSSPRASPTGTTSGSSSPATRGSASTSSSARARCPTPCPAHPSIARSARASSRAITCPWSSTSTAAVWGPAARRTTTIFR